MSEKFNVLQSAMASSERIFKLLDEPIEVAPPMRPRRRPAPAEGHIRFEDVWFAYTAERAAEDGARAEAAPNWVLKGITFDVRPGERVGIVGATGSGKTTLINLLLRFYDVQRGRITIDGVDVRELDLADLRGLFSLVLQDVHLFSGTVADNIRLGNPSIDDDRLRRAARAVHAEPFIERLPGGYAGAVAERGATLSVGQKQLLSFARALAFDPRVLILDEATSSVDTETELVIRDALHVLMADRTTIAIAHRLSTAESADEVIVFDGGRVVQRGPHASLASDSGSVYGRLHAAWQEQTRA
jgi:ATP-binding cassette subfamily B protein